MSYKGKLGRETAPKEIRKYIDNYDKIEYLLVEKTYVNKFSQVVGIIPKTNLCRDLITKFYELTGNTALDINEILDKHEPSDSYTLINYEYLEDLIEIFEFLDIESTKFKASGDYPLMFENEHMKGVIAPKIESE